MDVIFPILHGMGLGLASAVPIGPVNVQIARRALMHSFRAGAAIGIGAALVDVAYAVIACYGVGHLSRYGSLYQPLKWGGVCVLLLMAGACFVSAFRHHRKDPLEADAPAPSIHNGVLSGVLMVLVNPFTLLYWAGVSVMLGQNHHDNLPMICTGVLVGTFGWVLLFAGLLKWLGRFRKPWWPAMLDAVGGIALVAFAIVLMWSSPRSTL